MVSIKARREALARGEGNHGNDAHRHSGTARRQDHRLDGKSQRRTIPGRRGQDTLKRADAEQIVCEPFLRFRLERIALIVFFSCSTLSSSLVTAQAQPGPGQVNACNFLTSLLNTSIYLLVETRGSQIANVASDNLLAYNALIALCRGVYPGWGQGINASITGHCCKHGYDNMHEATFGKPISLPIPAANTYNVTDRFPSGPWKIYYENHNGTGFLSDAQYGDVAAYNVLELEREGNHAAALHELTLLNWMYDGHGIQDDVFRFSTKPEEHGIYQTFKSALYVLALAKTHQKISSELVWTLRSMQGSDGGFYTGYDINGSHSMTQENVETTSIAMFAIRSTPGWIKRDRGYVAFANLTITPPDNGFVQVHPNFGNDDVWTHNFTTTAVFDNRTLIGNQTLTLDPGDYANLPQWRLNVTLDPYIPHTITVTYGNATEVHRFPALLTKSCSWYECYGSIGFAPAPVLLTALPLTALLLAAVFLY